VSKAPETRTVALEKIRTDGGTQIRELDEANVQRLVEVLESKKPFDEDIRAWFDGADYWLSHGFHRHEAYKRVGRSKISVQVLFGSKEDAFDDACRPFNSRHGRPETTDERRARVKAYEARHADKSLRTVADWCGVSLGTVQRFRDERLSAVSNDTPDDDPPLTLGRDGKKYPAKQPRKQHEPSSVVVLDDAEELDDEPAEERHPAQAPSVFNLVVALVRLENAVMAQLEGWPEEDKPEAADRLEWIAKNVRNAS